MKNPKTVSSSKWNQPFPYEVPVFPIDGSKAKVIDYRLPSEQAVRDPYVPLHLPAYPPAHTYKRIQQISKKRVSGNTEVSENTNSSVPPKVKQRKGNNLKSIQQSLSIIENSVDSDKLIA